MNKKWIQLVIAALLEVLWVIGLTHAYNFWTWAATILLIILSNFLMIHVAQTLPTGTVYAVFVGLGAGGTVLAEIIFFGEPFQLAKVFLILTLLAGVIGMKLMTDHESDRDAERG